MALTDRALKWLAMGPSPSPTFSSSSYSAAAASEARCAASRVPSDLNSRTMGIVPSPSGWSRATSGEGVVVAGGCAGLDEPPCSSSCSFCALFPATSLILGEAGSRSRCRGKILETLTESSLSATSEASLLSSTGLTGLTFSIIML